VTAADRWDECPAARGEEGTPSAVLTVEQAEDLAARTLAAIEERQLYSRATQQLDADRERVASDLTGLREHAFLTDRRFTLCARDAFLQPCPDARRYSDGLLRTAALYGVTP
jgi:hypothetical protein